MARGIAPEAATAAQLDGAQAFAVGVIVYFFTMGVIGGALVTRYLLAYLRNPMADELVEPAAEAPSATGSPERLVPKIVSKDG
jgi:hypothetical protein